MKNWKSATVACLASLPSFTATAGDLPKPERIYSGTKSQTKTYMHQFVDSPDGTKYAFRYFPGENQAQGAKGKNAGGDPCEIWLCKSDLTGHQASEIHTVPNEKETLDDGAVKTSIPGIEDIIDDAFEKELLFYENGVSWAKPSVFKKPIFTME